jgi:hypothetical protein
MIQAHVLHDQAEPNGQTIRENNLDRPHAIPIGALVEARWDEWFGNGACWKVHARLWVVAHTRDCDGTPLYTLSRWNDPAFGHHVRDEHYGFGEESLTVIPLTDELRRGHKALEWESPAPDT